MTSRIDKELSLLRQRWPELHSVSDGRWVHLPQYGPLPDGWSPGIMPVVFQIQFADPARQMRIVLAELLLRHRDEAVVVLGMLVIVLGRNRIAGRLRVARELNVFLGNVRGVSPDFDVGSVRLVDARHRVLTFAVMITTAHALAVLTVSHDSPVR